MSFLNSLFGSSQTPTFSPTQSAVQSSLGSNLLSYLSNPGQITAQLAPLKSAAVGQVNTNTDNLETRLQNSETQRGFGESGTVGLKTNAAEINRSNQLGNLESQFAGLNLQQQNFNEGLASQFGFADPGKTTSSSPFSDITSLLSLFGGGGFGGGGGAEAPTFTGLPGGESIYSGEDI